MAEQTIFAERFFCPVCGTYVNGSETRHCGVRPERDVEPEWPVSWSGWYGTEGPHERENVA